MVTETVKLQKTVPGKASASFLGVSMESSIFVAFIFYNDIAGNAGNLAQFLPGNLFVFSAVPKNYRYPYQTQLDLLYRNN